MKYSRFALALVIGVSISACAWAGDPPPLLLAQGTVEKVDASTLTVKPRGPDGKFGKNLVLKLTGTSMVKTVSSRLQKGKMVIVQSDASIKDLQTKQVIALVYTMAQDSPVLLTAVVQPPREK